MIPSSFSVSLFIAYSFISVVVSRTFTITNHCNSTVWPGIVTASGNGPVSSSGFALLKGQSKNVTTPKSWNGRVWGRTFCAQSSTGNFSCLTGDCGSGQVDCAGFGAPPVTLAEFALDQSGGQDFYDVSLVDGYNLPLIVVPRGGSGNCSSIPCAVNINATCPQELMVTSTAADGEGIACRNPCEAFKIPQFCCTGNYSTSETCKPTAYAQIFKKECPRAYSYPFDDQSSTFTCASADYSITFCPDPSTTKLTPSTTVPPTGSETEPQGKGKSSISTVTIVAIVVPITVIVALLSLGSCLLRKRRKKKYEVMQENDAINEIKTVESLQFDLSTIETATRKFSVDNKLGQGGFGEVYKGILANGQEIAVKKLSSSSRQGAEEFKNEVVLLAKLQHRNLVRLLGFCLEKEEKLLIYEFMPNKSLDYFLFDPEKQGQLDWPRRYKIIGGIAKGILYLHEDSRLRIIHRDLKGGNILLDKDMNPKIADFGMARIFEVEQIQGNTNRIVGTHGYMSPEYAMEGLFSVKSDVYSFGVLLLEIVSGKRNNRFYYSEQGESLLTFAWNLWHEGEGMKLMDPSIEKSGVAIEVLKCIQMGLLCVQDDPKGRPTMSSVVFMLANDTIPLPQPKKPVFSVGQYIGSSVPSSSSSRPKDNSINQVTLSTVTPR